MFAEREKNLKVSSVEYLESVRLASSRPAGEWIEKSCCADVLSVLCSAEEIVLPLCCFPVVFVLCRHREGPGLPQTLHPPLRRTTMPH